MLNLQRYQIKAHDEAEEIFRKILPETGMNVREEQIQLCHIMLDALLNRKIALCDAGVGIGKTYAYLSACIIMQKYAAGPFKMAKSDPIVISTSSISLQKAIIEEYIPFLSRVFTENGIIHRPIRTVVRKGKEHFVCDIRLIQRLEAVENKIKNADQKKALFSLRRHYDLDKIQGLSGYDRRHVCVPKFCPRECPEKVGCRYQRYLKRAKEPDIFIQICNHNYLLADASHRVKGYRPLLADYQALIVDEAHQLPEAARQMYGKKLGMSEVKEICKALEKEHQSKDAALLKAEFGKLLEFIKENAPREGSEGRLLLSEECKKTIEAWVTRFRKLNNKLKNVIPSWVFNQLEEAEIILNYFSNSNGSYILYFQQDSAQLPVFCATSRKASRMLKESLWDRGIPAILTSGTLKAGTNFERTKQVMGLNDVINVHEFVAESPFQYHKNCLLYLPKNLKKCMRGSQEEAAMLAEHIRSLIHATYGHTLVLFTSYSLMGSVCQIIKDDLPVPMIEVWRHSQEEIARFKTMKNAVLLAAGTCWEGVDFPGDIVSSLIIVKLPFAVPNPISESEKERYETLNEYIQSVIVPDMQKKLRQGFGRAIRTEEDTCVVSILDERAIAGGRYHKDVLRALPDCQRADELSEVERFISSRKEPEYYM